VLWVGRFNGKGNFVPGVQLWPNNELNNPHSFLYNYKIQLVERVSLYFIYVLTVQWSSWGNHSMAWMGRKGRPSLIDFFACPSVTWHWLQNLLGNVLPSSDCQWIPAKVLRSSMWSLQEYTGWGFPLALFSRPPHTLQCFCTWSSWYCSELVWFFVSIYKCVLC